LSIKKSIGTGQKVARSLIKLIGWTLIDSEFPSDSGVIVAYPHTSNWDFCIGILAKWALGINVRFLAKDTLFQVPLLSTWLKYLGGIAVDRTSPQGYVELLVQELKSEKNFWVVFTPEGTRKRTPGWRSGFYHLALAAQAPIGLAVLDFKNKKIGIAKFLVPTGVEETDIAMIRVIYENCGGFQPDNASPIVFWSPRGD
jgi:1-acyl-sn-glycerol-3-phosphate acyltransferase